MARCTTKSYVVTLRMYPTADDLEVLNHRFNAVHHVTNVMVKRAIQLVDQLERNKEYKTILKQVKDRKLTKKEKDRLNEIRMSYGLSEYDFHFFLKHQRELYDNHLDAFTVQKIATKVWSSVSTYLFRNGDKIHFKKKKDVNSFEGKSNKTGLRYKDGYVTHLGLNIRTGYKKKDQYIAYALKNHRIKYCRIKRKWHKHNYRYYVDLVMEGIPPKMKAFNNDSTVGIDIGPSTIAVVSDSKCILRELAENVNSIEKELRVLNRRLDRQRRANNPDNYNEDGTIKEGKKTWNNSRRQTLTYHKVKMLYQKRANQLEYSHILLANEILSLGSNIIVENMEWAELAKRAKEDNKTEKKNKKKSRKKKKETVIKETSKPKKKKRFGKSIANHAPSKLIEIINTKLSYIDKQVVKVDCFKTAATKYNHQTGELMEIKLKDRFVSIDGNDIQRDLHSAFNLKHVIVHKGKTDKETTYEYDVDKMNETFSDFLVKHNETIKNIEKEKQLGKVFPSCIGI